MNSDGKSGPNHTAPAVAVRVDGVDVSGLCDVGLRSRLGEIGRAESRLAAMKAAVLGELARRRGNANAEHAAKETLSVSGRAARSDVKAAVAMGELDATREALADGRVPAGHAQLIARAAGDAPVDEAFLAERARHGAAHRHVAGGGGRLRHGEPPARQHPVRRWFPDPDQ